MELMRAIGQPISEDFSLVTMPHTISFAIMYRARIDSFLELSKDRRPPKNLWDKPFRLNEFFDNIFKVGATSSDNYNEDFMEYNTEEVE